MHITVETRGATDEFFLFNSMPVQELNLINDKPRQYYAILFIFENYYFLSRLLCVRASFFWKHCFLSCAINPYNIRLAFYRWFFFSVFDLNDYLVTRMQKCKNKEQRKRNENCNWFIYDDARATSRTGFRFS